MFVLCVSVCGLHRSRVGFCGLCLPCGLCCLWSCVASSSVSSSFLSSLSSCRCCVVSLFSVRQRFLPHQWNNKRGLVAYFVVWGVFRFFGIELCVVSVCVVFIGDSSSCVVVLMSSFHVALLSSCQFFVGRCRQSWSSCWCRVTRCLSRESIAAKTFSLIKNGDRRPSNWRLGVVCFYEKHTSDTARIHSDSSLLIL